MAYPPETNEDLQLRNRKLGKLLMAAILQFREEELMGWPFDFVPGERAANASQIEGETALCLAIQRFAMARAASDAFRQADEPTDHFYPLDVATLAVALGRAGSVFASGAPETARRLLAPLLRLEGWRLAADQEDDWAAALARFDWQQVAANDTLARLLGASWRLVGLSDRQAFEPQRRWWNQNCPANDTDLEPL